MPMRSFIDFSSWSSVLSTIASLLLVTGLMMGIRLLFMQTIQKRRERENRQINERLKLLMAAYKTLGSSFTGQLEVSPTHVRDVLRRERAAAAAAAEAAGASGAEVSTAGAAGAGDVAPSVSDTLSERQRLTRDAVEAALSDVILLGTEAQVRLAAQAALDMAEGRSIHTRELVVSLRHFIREALHLEPIPADVRIPDQGPLRPAAGSPNRRAGQAPGGAGGGGRGGAGGGGGGMGTMGVGLGVGAAAPAASSAVAGSSAGAAVDEGLR